MEDRLIALESKLAFTEDMLEALNLTIFRQLNNRIDQLQQQIRLLYQQMQSNSPSEENNFDRRARGRAAALLTLGSLGSAVDLHPSVARVLNSAQNKARRRCQGGLLARSCNAVLWRIQCPPGGLKRRGRQTALRSVCRGPTLHSVARRVWQALRVNAIRRMNVNRP